jgi:uncharacterized protein (TIGR02117 family)
MAFLSLKLTRCVLRTPWQSVTVVATRAAAALALATALAACAPMAAPPPSEVDHGPRVHAVRVLSNGWHTAILVSREEVVETGLLPEARDFPTAAYLEFGWGDRRYYSAKEKTIGMTLDAAFVETPAIMHVAARGEAPGPSSKLEVKIVALSALGFQAMIRAIAAHFERPQSGRASPVAAGLYADSRFYNAHGAFHLFNTCNTWTARMLSAGGVALSPAGVVTADDLMTRLGA